MEQTVTFSAKASLSRHARKVVAALALGAVALLASCSNVNAAATVGNETISSTQVQNSVASILKLRKTIDTSSLNLPQGADIARAVLNLHIVEALLKQAAAAKKITATPAEISKFKADLLSQIGGAANLNNGLIQNSIAAEDFDLYASYMVLLNDVTTALNTKSDKTIYKSYLTDYFSKVKVTVNARYGKWNATTGQVEAVDATSGAVASPSPTASK